MIEEGIRRWFHFRLCGWIGNHAPAGLVFQCVLRTYSRCTRESRSGHFTADHMLNESGRWAEDACKGKRR